MQPMMPASEEFVLELRAAVQNLHEVARATKALDPPRDGILRALDEAWSNVARIERLVGAETAVGVFVRTRRFVVVDDSADMRFLVTRTLRSIAPGARIDVAPDSATALELLADADLGDGVVVISDHEMGPGATGAELLAEIATRHPRAHRVLYSGHPPETLEPVAPAAHAVLSKDWSKNALRAYFGVA